jgi:alpha-1,6-mannosyltransferase
VLAARRIGLAWTGLGFAGSTLIAADATRLLDGRPIRWWWRLPLPLGHTLTLNLFWIGVTMLCVAWLGLGSRLAGTPGARPRDVVLVAAVWALPLMLGPALFSQDMYSYLAQGSILQHGLNPYHVAPTSLARWHETGLLSAVSTEWRTTTAPYGPGFLAVAGLLSSAAGSHIALGIELVRGLELVGLGLLAVFVPRLARRLGADPVRAVWLAVASPLTLLYFVGGGHNDALMAGLTVAGVTLALEDRRLAGLALCALAATVKLPALAAVAVIGVCWLRAEPQRARTIVVSGVAVVAGVLLAAGALTGVGLSWVSGSLFSTPASIRLAITPATAIAVTIHELGHGVHHGVEYAAAGLERAAADVAIALVLAFAAWLCLRAREDRLARMLGLMLIFAAIGGPVAWPWYLIWGVALLAADPVAQRSPWLAIAVVVPVFVVMAGGQVAVSLPHAYQVLLVDLAALAVAVAKPLSRRRRARMAPAQLATAVSASAT